MQANGAAQMVGKTPMRRPFDEFRQSRIVKPRRCGIVEVRQTGDAGGVKDWFLVRTGLPLNPNANYI